MELAHLKKIFHGFNNGICVLDEQLKVYYWNHWLTHHTAIYNDDIVNNYLHHYVEGINKSVLQRKIKTALMLNSPTFYPESLKNHLFKIPMNNASKEDEMYMKQNISIIPYGNTKKVIVVISDKTKEHIYSQKLKNKIEEINALNGELKDDAKIIDSYICKIRINSKKSILSISQKLAETLGVFKKDIQGKRFGAVFTSLKNYMKKENFPELFFEGMDKESIYVYTLGDEKVYLKVINHHEDDQNELIYLFQDITDFVNLQYQQEKLLNQSRSAAMGEMISMIAHQWRQPLTVLSSTMAKIRFKDSLGTLKSHEVNEGLEEMEKVVVHLSQTISDFSNFFKPSKRNERLTVDSLFERALKFSKNFIFEQEIVIKKKGRLESIVDLRANEMVQVFMTLIQNSADAFREYEVTKPCIELGFEVQENYYQFSVKDNAGGIKKEHITHIFDPYFSTKSKNGTGIGLYMVKKVIQESMKGSLEVTSKNGNTVFEIKIPMDSEVISI